MLKTKEIYVIILQFQILEIWLQCIKPANVFIYQSAEKLTQISL